MLTLPVEEPRVVDLHIPSRALALTTCTHTYTPPPPPPQAVLHPPEEVAMCALPVPAMARLRALQAAGYRCEHSPDGRSCPSRAGLAVRQGKRVIAVCYLHYPLYREAAPCPTSTA